MVEPTLLNISISTISNVLVAFATFILAIITWQTVKHMRKQMIYIQKQHLLTLSEQNPILQLNEFNIKDNSISLKAKNVGKGTAYQIGVHAKFYLAKLKVDHYDEKTKLHWVNFEYDPDVLMDENEGKKYKIINNGYVNFLSKGKSKVVLLKENQEVSTDITPEFYLRYPFKLGTTARTIKLKDLIEVLEKNNRRFIAVSFELVYKNSIEDTQDSLELTKFIFDIKRHKNLEEAFKEGRSFNFEALSNNQLQTKIGGLGYKEYKGMRSMKNYVPGEHDKEDFWD